MNSLLLYDTGDAACGAAFIGGPVAMAWSRFSDKVKEEAKAEYLASIEKYKVENGYAIPGEFVILTGFK